MSTSQVSIIVAILLNVNIMIGAGIFVSPPAMSAIIGDSSYLAWLVSSLIFLPVLFFTPWFIVSPTSACWIPPVLTTEIAGPNIAKFWAHPVRNIRLNKIKKTFFINSDYYLNLFTIKV